MTSETPHYHIVPKDLLGNLCFRKRILTEARRDKELQSQMVALSKVDILFYINVFCWTFDPRQRGEKNIPFITYRFQDEAIIKILRCVLEGRDYCMPKSRDMGASWMGLLVYEWLWHFYPDMTFLLVSRNEDYVDKRGNAKSLFWKIDHLHANQPIWLLPSGRELGWRDPNRRLLHLKNADTGSVIDGESTTGDVARGDRRTGMFIDEHAAMDVNDGFRVLRATRDTTNSRGFNSTPQGSNNAFYEVVYETNAEVIRLHWSRHPVKAKGLYTSKDGQLIILDKETKGYARWFDKGKPDSKVVKFPDNYPFILDGKMRSPWYDIQCARSANQMEVAQELDIDFMGSNYQFFDPGSIDTVRKRWAMEPARKGMLEFRPDTYDPKRFTDEESGLLWLWMDLRSDGTPPEDVRYVIGADVAAGTGASNSVLSIVNMETREKVGVYRNSNILPLDFARFTYAVLNFFNRAFLVPDRSGPTGEVFVKEILALGYGNIYYRRIEKKVTRLQTDEPGVWLMGAARTSLLEEYRDALHKWRFINHSEQGLNECLQFVRTPRGTIEHSASITSQDPSGARLAHGDEVIADALANLGLNEWGTGRVQESYTQIIPQGSVAWRMQERERELSLRSAPILLGQGWE